MKPEKIVAIVFGVVGLALVLIYAGWQTAVGVFLCLWGNNLSCHKSNAAGSSAPACWPLPPEWATFIPPQAVNIKRETVSAENGGGTLTRPVWNEQWLRGLEAYVRGIVRDELSKANADLTGKKKLEKEVTNER